MTDRPDPSRSHPSRSGWRSWLTLPFDNWPARIYLILVVIAFAYGIIDATLVNHDDASFALIYAIILTAPVSLVLSCFGIVGIPIGALVNATVIGAIARAVGQARHR